MNIAFFLIPKNEVATIEIESTVRQALEKMEHHKYTSVPLIDEKGKYKGTLTEGDLLWFLKKEGKMNLQELEGVKLKDVPRRHDNKAISIYAEMGSILLQATEQNFVPVIDDHGTFIGIIRRREIIEFYAKSVFKAGETGNEQE
ncbi:CBS domain-containing protein [Bacillus fengqiuensis]|nr:CBS domain-containing protein [Bacillus fengqiuensis]